MASTELRGAGSHEAWLGVDDSARPAEAYASLFDAAPGRLQDKAGADSVAASDGPAPAEPIKAASGPDRFRWVLPLIAFAGLSAMFGRRRSGGRGLIAG